MKRILRLFLIITAFAFAEKASSQCVYRSGTAESGLVELNIPEDFPVFHFGGSESREDFLIRVDQWKTQNPGFENVSFLPATTHDRIEVSKVVFQKMDLLRKTAFQSNAAFYIIID